MNDLSAILSRISTGAPVKDLLSLGAKMRVLAEANPWSRDLCARCVDGLYPGTDQAGEEVHIPCKFFEAPQCPQWQKAKKAITDNQLRELLVAEGFGRRYVYGTHAAKIQHKDRLKAYAAEWQSMLHSGCGLFLCGPLGTGKSRAMAYLGALLHSHGVPGGKVRCLEGPEMVLEVHRSASAPMGGPRGQEAQPGWLRGSCFLFVDDVGSQVEAEWVGKHYGGVIQARYRHSLPLIMATNLSPAMLYELVGERAADRMGEVGPDGKPLFETLVFVERLRDAT